MLMVASTCLPTCLLWFFTELCHYLVIPRVSVGFPHLELLRCFQAVALELQDTAAAEELGTGWARAVLRREEGKQGLRYHHVTIRQTGQNEGGELLSSGLVLFFSLSWERYCWLLGIRLHLQPKCCFSTEVAGRADSSNNFCFLRMERQILSCVVDRRAWILWCF